MLTNDQTNDLSLNSVTLHNKSGYMTHCCVTTGELIWSAKAWHSFYGFILAYPF